MAANGRPHSVHVPPDVGDVNERRLPRRLRHRTGVFDLLVRFGGLHWPVLNQVLRHLILSQRIIREAHDHRAKSNLG